MAAVTEAPRLDDGVVVLRPWDPRDVEWVVATCQDPEIQRWTRVPVPYGRAHGEDFIMREAPSKWREGRGASFACTLASTGEIVGSCGATLLDVAARIGEVGYYCAPVHRRRGYTARAVELVSHWCFEAARWERLELPIDPENLGSRRVAERAGYSLEAVLAHAVVHRGQVRDVALYKRLRGPSAVPLAGPAHDSPSAPSM